MLTVSCIAWKTSAIIRAHYIDTLALCMTRKRTGMTFVDICWKSNCFPWRNITYFVQKQNCMCIVCFKLYLCCRILTLIAACASCRSKKKNRTSYNKPLARLETLKLETILSSSKCFYLIFPQGIVNNRPKNARGNIPESWVLSVSNVPS